MAPEPTLPPLDETEDVLAGGHLWLQEWVTGPILAVEMDDSGMLSFERADDRPADAPSLREAVGHVRESVDREAFRSGVEDVHSHVLYGIATRYEGVTYDWESLPPFLGVAVWNGDDGRFAPPDAAERGFEAIGLSPVPALEKELPVEHFDPDRFDPPDSRYRTGPVAGTIVRNKRGPMGILHTEGVRSPSADDPEDVLQSTIDRVLDRAIEDGPDARGGEGAEAIVDRVFERVLRVTYHDLGDTRRYDPDELRSRVATAVGERIHTSR